MVATKKILTEIEIVGLVQVNARKSYLLVMFLIEVKNFRE